MTAPVTGPGRTVAAAPSAAAVELRGVGRAYGAHQAVADLDLVVRPSELMAVLGPSGAGKSTVLGLVAGFVEPTSGTISIAGRDVTGLPPHRRQVGVVFQHYALFPHLDVLGNVEFPLRARGVRGAERRERALAALRLVGLVDMQRRRATTLSGGQQQRVALARALVFQPAVLLLDEPLAALDRQLREQMRGEIKALQRRTGATTLLVTHDQDEALTLADRILLMRHGRMEQLGTPRDLYERPATRFAAEFIGVGSLLTVRIPDVGGTAQLPTGHRVPLAPDADPVVGSSGWVVLRPEAARLTTSGDPVALQVTVTDVVYAGARCTVHAATADGQPVLVDAAPDLSLRPGDPAAVSVRSDGLWFIRS